MRTVKTYPKYLKEHVKFFYSVFASEFENSYSTHRRLPDGTLDIVFNLGAPVIISRNGVNFLEMPEVVLTGLYPNKSFLHYTGAVHLVGAVFQPGSAHLFVNDSLAYYTECNAAAEMIFGKEVCVLLEQIRDCFRETEKHDLLERFLLNHLGEKNENRYSSKISGAVQQIHASEGNIEMSAIYKNQCMSERTFRRKFNETVGMSPKQYSSIIRVKSFSKRYELARCGYTPILSDLGYTDQSHFNKEFQKIVGTSPTEYFTQLNKMGAEFIHLI